MAKCILYSIKSDLWISVECAVSDRQFVWMWWPWTVLGNHRLGTNKHTDTNSWHIALRYHSSSYASHSATSSMNSWLEGYLLHLRPWNAALPTESKISWTKSITVQKDIGSSIDDENKFKVQTVLARRRWKIHEISLFCCELIDNIHSG